MPKYLPDDDEGEIGVSLIDLALIALAALIVVPGVIWWIVKLVAIVRVTVEAFR